MQGLRHGAIAVAVLRNGIFTSSCGPLRYANSRSYNPATGAARCVRISPHVLQERYYASTVGFKAAQPIAKCLAGCSRFLPQLAGACQRPGAQPHTVAPLLRRLRRTGRGHRLTGFTTLATTGNRYVVRTDLSDLRFLV